MTSMKRPKVKIKRGNESTISTGRTKAFSAPKSKDANSNATGLS